MPNKNGLHLIKPTSIVSTGTGNSSSINTNGSVTFSTCATLSLNGVFSADYDNYMIVVRATSSGAVNVTFRLRVSGSDNSTASSYVAQYIDAAATTVSAARTTSNLADIMVFNATQRCGLVINIYGPYLAQPTALRTVAARDNSSAGITDWAVTHNQSTAYDGFTLTMSNTDTFTGLLCVYGMRN